MPKGTEGKAAINDENSRKILGYGLVAVGFLILFHEFFALLNTSLMLGVILVVIGILVILKGGWSKIQSHCYRSANNTAQSREPRRGSLKSFAPSMLQGSLQYLSTSRRINTCEAQN